MYGCRAYPLKKKIPRTQKLEPRAHIGYLVGYDSTNIYRIWIPSEGKVVRTRDVSFDEERFYDPSELGLGHVLREEIENIVEFIGLLPPTKEHLIVDLASDEEFTTANDTENSQPDANPAEKLQNDADNSSL